MTKLLRIAWRTALYCSLVVVVLGLLLIPLGQWLGFPVKPTVRTITEVAFTPPGPWSSADASPDERLRRLSLDRADTTEIRNVILFIGDGMGLAQIATTVDLAGPDASFVLPTMPVTGLVRTASASELVTDSGAGGTALATGVKTRNKRIAMTPDSVAMQSLLHMLRAQGKAVGVLTTSYLVDATPAAFTARVRHRDQYAAIARQMLEADAEVLMGGNGEGQFPEAQVAEAEARGYKVVRNAEALATVPDTARVLALWPEREGFETHGPPLPGLVRRALRQLSTNPDGFFLVVEQEQTDGGGHANRLDQVRSGVAELDAAVQEALAFAAADGQTLVLVTADHDTGGVSIVKGRYDEGTAEVRWNTFGHTGAWVPLFAAGPGAWAFTGTYENTAVPRRLAVRLGLEDFPAPVGAPRPALVERR
jgi:alkaline phosphatase